MADTETYGDVTYKGEKGMLVVTDKVFHYTANGASKTSVKCSWARVEKRQLSPDTSAVHMLKLVLVSGKTAVFEVPTREALEELRNDAQSRMELAKQNRDDSLRASRRQSETGFGDPSSSRDWVDEPSERMTKRTQHRRRSSTSGSPNGDACGWCCFGTLVCWLCVCIICILIAVALFLVYWFVVKDNEEDVLKTIGIDDSPTKDRNRPPDVGEEERYGIRSVYHDWDQNEVTLQYKLSDYIMDNSIQYKLYDGLDCRRSNNDITGDGNWLFIDLKLPADGGADLTNDGRGSRDVDIHFTLNKGEISNAPFFVPNGLEKARLNFCMGLIVNYNQVDYWSRVEEVCLTVYFNVVGELCLLYVNIFSCFLKIMFDFMFLKKYVWYFQVNAVEVAIQLDIDLTDFRRIEDAVIQTVIRPQYNRRSLLRSREYPQLKALQDQVEEEEDEEDFFVDEFQGSEMMEVQ